MWTLGNAVQCRGVGWSEWHLTSRRCSSWCSKGGGSSTKRMEPGVGGDPACFFSFVGGGRSLKSLDGRNPRTLETNSKRRLMVDGSEMTLATNLKINEADGKCVSDDI